jgi:predicted acyl esterase
LTDHFAPSIPDTPTILIRTPYGRGIRLRILARALAHQGFHVVVQSCRGTYDSGGTFEPMRHERDDGLDTLEWLRRQPWYTGDLFTFGPSYVGFVQWALAADAAPDLKAMATIVTAADFRRSTYAGGSFSLDTVLTWAALLSAQRGPRLANFVELRRGQPRLHRGLAHLPLSEADVVATGERVPFVRDWLAEPDDDYWDQRGHTVDRVTAPVLMVGGWYDIFLPWQLDDYAALRAAGARPRLTIGPWTHGSFGLVRESIRESVAFFRDALAPQERDHAALRDRDDTSPRERDNTSAPARDHAANPPRDHAANPARDHAANPARDHAAPAPRDHTAAPPRDLTALTERDDTPPPSRDHAAPREREPAAREPVRVHIGGLGWRGFGDWPPAGARTVDWVLKPDAASRFRYDPADPTPAVGGPRLVANVAGRRDNRALEARPDVLTFTGDPLEAPLTIIGPVAATVRVTASGAHFDLFVRLCDVTPDGHSWNICDGLVRVTAENPATVRDVRVDLWPAAHRFAAGHRLRVQVSGGAHPRFARNTGSGEPLATATTLVPVEVEVIDGSTLHIMVLE